MANDRQCEFDGCDRKWVAKGLCDGHWQQQRLGVPLRQLGTRRLTAEDRFWSKIDRSGGPDACWLWTAPLNRQGYAQFWDGQRKVYAHRYPFEQIHGPVPRGLFTDHTCWVRNCVNPAHLRLVTHQANLENRQGANSNAEIPVRGVQWHKRANKYVVQVTHLGRTVHGGLYLDLAEAEAAAISLRCRLMTHNDADRQAS